MSNQQPKRRVVFGGFIIIVGVLALLDKLNIFSFNIGTLFHFWPTVFVVVGILKLTESRSRSSILIGLCFILVGSAMMLNKLGIFHFSFRDWWPVLLIALGISVVLKDRSAEPSSGNFFEGDEHKNNNVRLDITAVMGGNKTVNSSQDFKGGEITAIMGGVDLDLRNASIPTEAVLNVWATWGGIEIRVPNDWEVVNRGTAILGGIEDKTIPSPGTGKRLIITGTAIMGGVVIKN
jgi:predicted membrane protein